MQQLLDALRRLVQGRGPVSRRGFAQGARGEANADLLVLSRNHLYLAHLRREAGMAHAEPIDAFRQLLPRLAVLGDERGDERILGREELDSRDGERLVAARLLDDQYDLSAVRRARGEEDAPDRGADREEARRDAHDRLKTMERDDRADPFVETHGRPGACVWPKRRLTLMVWATTGGTMVSHAVSPDCMRARTSLVKMDRRFSS